MQAERSAQTNEPWLTAGAFHFNANGIPVGNPGLFRLVNGRRVSFALW